MKHAPITRSLLTCPHCGHQREEEMPVDACQWLYECVNCAELLRPNPGDCCVFCSFGSIPCPPIQQKPTCCGNTGNESER